VVFIRVEGQGAAIAESPLATPFGDELPFGDEFFRRFFGDRLPGIPRGQAPQGPRSEPRAMGQGSGFVFAAQSGLLADKTYIMTNNHVVEGAERIRVTFQDGREFDAEVTGRDPQSDVAVVEIKTGGLPALALGDSAKLEVGEWVVAIGNPFGLSHTLTVGVVSATGRTSLGINDYEDFIQTDAAINPGNSGGPLVDMKGNVVGMNTAIFSRSGSYAGIGFAVPADLIKKVALELINKGHVARGYLGVQLAQDLDEDISSGLSLPAGTKGALVASVQADTPAAKAGVESGDVIVAVDDKPVSNNSELMNAIGLQAPGQKVNLDLFRNGKKRRVTVLLEKFPEANVAANSPDGQPTELFAGMNLKPISASNVKSLREQFDFRSQTGLLITDVAENSRAAAAGLRPSDVLLKANRRELKSLNDLASELKKSKKLLIQFERKGAILFASLRGGGG
jgi:serine protease Do